MTWKELPGYEGLYEVSDTGLVKSLRSNKILSQRQWDNYLVVRLQRVDGTITTKGVHRLVMETFCPLEDYTNMTVNHIDHDKINNQLNNLEWMTNADNIRESFQAGLHKQNHKGGNNKMPVECVETGEVFDSAAAAARKVNIKSPGKIGDAIKNPTKTCGGYHWKRPDYFLEKITKV